MNLNLNPVTALTWSWRALRGHSVTCAALFALGLLGLAVIPMLRHLLSRLGAPWYVWLLGPALAVAYCARKEVEWLPDAGARRRWARGIFFGAIALAALIAKLRSPPRAADDHGPAAPAARAGR